MPKVNVYNQNGETVGEMELADHIFGIEPHEHALHSAVVMQQASQRQGTHSTKNRSAVRGGGRKPWRQKGTGRARQGSIRSPQWVGGGVVFGPTPRKYGYSLPKKVRRLALKSAISSKTKSEEMKVLDTLDLQQTKTKQMVDILAKLQTTRKVLLVTDDHQDHVFLSSRNIPGVTYLTAEKLNVLDILNHDHLIMTQGAVAKVEEVLQ